MTDLCLLIYISLNKQISQTIHPANSMQMFPFTDVAAAQNGSGNKTWKPTHQWTKNIKLNSSNILQLAWNKESFGIIT